MITVRKCLTSVVRVCQPLTRIQAKHTLPQLQYEYNSLEPIICKEIMEMHHKKHHQCYVNNLNEIEDNLKQCTGKNDLKARECLLHEYETNLGGHINHSLFWRNITPQKTMLDGELLQLINQQFGSVRCMKEKIIEAAGCLKGAGWVWLGYNRKTGCLVITTTTNEERLYHVKCLYPLLGIDVWEHAYYLQYLDSRRCYTKSILEVINWEEVRQRYLDAKCCIVKLA